MDNEKKWVQTEKDAKVITKPHGREVWIELNDRYCMKRIYMNAGGRSSFHYHEKKHEVNYIISGEGEAWLENDEGVIEKTRVKAGDFYVVQPPKKHRIIAITDLVMQEASTPEVDDVIRLEDDYERGDGKLESEHTDQ